MWLLLTVTHAWAFELTLTDTLVDQAANVIYNRVNGNVQVHSPGDLLTSFELRSRSGAFSTPFAWNWGTCGQLFDVLPCTPARVIQFDFEGFETFNFGGPRDVDPVLPPNLSADWIISDLTVDGSRLLRGKINTSPGVCFKLPST